MLELHGFFRVHTSYLVNLTTVRSFIKGANSRLLMKSGDAIPVARARKEQLLSKI